MQLQNQLRGTIKEIYNLKNTETQEILTVDGT